MRTGAHASFAMFSMVMSLAVAAVILSQKAHTAAILSQIGTQTANVIGAATGKVQK